MTLAFRERASHAGVVGLVAAVVAVATQYFVALPVGNQPNWLALFSAMSIPQRFVMNRCSSPKCGLKASMRRKCPAPAVRAAIAPPATLMPRATTCAG